MSELHQSPKSRFLSYAPFVKDHLKLIGQPEFQRAIDYSLMQMLEDLTKGRWDGNNAATRFYELSGAVDFAKRLRGLGFPLPEKVPTKTQGEIDHNV